MITLERSLRSSIILSRFIYHVTNLIGIIVACLHVRDIPWTTCVIITAFVTGMTVHDSLQPLRTYLEYIKWSVVCMFYKMIILSITMYKVALQEIAYFTVFLLALSICWHIVFDITIHLIQVYELDIKLADELPYTTDYNIHVPLYQQYQEDV